MQSMLIFLRKKNSKFVIDQHLSPMMRNCLPDILFLFSVLLEDNIAAAKDITSLLSENCVGNEDLSHYNGSNLVTVKRYLNQDGCVWDPHLNNGADNITEIGDAHHRRKRASGPAKEGENPTAVLLRDIVHAFHILSICILAIMVFEVSTGQTVLTAHSVE